DVRQDPRPRAAYFTSAALGGASAVRFVRPAPSACDSAGRTAGDGRSGGEVPSRRGRWGPAGSDPSTQGWESAVEILKVSSKSAPNAVAGALAGVIRQQQQVELHVVGAGALNQAIKAIAIGRSYL